MKNQRTNDTWETPEIQVKPSHNLWKQAGAVMAAAACFLLSPASTRHAQASPDTMPGPYLGNELGTLGVITAVNDSATTQTNINTALKAILSETENHAVTDPELFVQYILTQRDGTHGSAHDAATYAPALVTNAINGLLGSVWAGSGDVSKNPVTQDAIVLIARAAADATASLAAGTALPAGSGTGAIATRNSSAATAVTTLLTNIGNNAVSTTIPVGSSAPALAAAIFSSLAQETYPLSTVAGASTTTLPAANLAAVAGSLVTKVAVSKQPDAGTTVTNAYLSALGFSGTDAATQNTIVKSLVKNLPLSAVPNAVTAVLNTTGQTYTTNPTNTLNLLKLSVAAAADIPKGAAVAAGILAVSGTEFGTLITTGSNVTATYTAIQRSAVLASLAAGASVANPIGSGTYVSQALTAETTGTSVPATATQKQDLITNVVSALAPLASSTVTQVQADGVTGVSRAVSEFLNNWTSAFADASNAKVLNVARTTLAQNIVKASLVGGTSAVQAVAGQLQALAKDTSDTNLGALVQSLLGAAAIPATTVGYNSILQAVTTSALGWSWNSSTPITFAWNMAGGSSGLTNAIKAQVTAAVVQADSADAVAITGSITSQYTGPASLANKASIVAAVLPNVSGTNIAGVISGIITQVDANQSSAAQVATTADADRKSLATKLATANATLSGTIASLIGKTALSGFDGAQLGYDVANAVISANPLNNIAVDAVVTNMMPTVTSATDLQGISNQVLFTEKLIAGSVKSVVEIAKQVGAIIQGQGTSLATFVTTLPNVGTATLYANAQIANIAAGFAKNVASTPDGIEPVLKAVLNKGATNGGAVVAAIVANDTGVSLAAQLTGSAAAIVTGTYAGTVPATLAGIGNKVIAVSGTDATGIAAAAGIANALEPMISDMHAASKTVPDAPIAPVLPSNPTAAQTKTYNTALAAYNLLVTARNTAITNQNTQNTTRLGDLGALAGGLAVGVSDSGVLSAIINATTTGNLSGLQVTGTSTFQSVDVSALLSSTASLVAYGAKVATTLTTSAAPFTRTFLQAEQSTLNLNTADAGNVSVFAAKLISGATAKASDIAWGTTLYATGPGGSTLAALTGTIGNTLSMLTPKASMANAAAGVAGAEYSLGASGTTMAVIAGNFAEARIAVSATNETIPAKDTAVIAIAAAVAKVAPLYAWNVGQTVAADLINPSDKGALVKSLITAVSTLLTGPTANERIGLLTAAVASGMNNASDIATIVANAIKLKPGAAYDIFGSVVASTGVDSGALQTALVGVTGTPGAFSAVSYTASTSVTNAISQAKNDITNSTGHFFNTTTGDVTGNETSVTNS